MLDTVTTEVKDNAVCRIPWIGSSQFNVICQIVVFALRRVNATQVFFVTDRLPDYLGMTIGAIRANADSVPMQLTVIQIQIITAVPHVVVRIVLVSIDGKRCRIIFIQRISISIIPFGEDNRILLCCRQGYHLYADTFNTGEFVRNLDGLS